MQDWLEKTAESFNKYYNCYRASWCKKSLLPMYQSKDKTKMRNDGLYLRSEAKRLRIKIDTTQVCGWYRLYNGYTPLFKKTNWE